MLRVTVELWPNGEEQSKSRIATASIGRVRDDSFADYMVSLEKAPLGPVGDAALVLSYPRRGASVWDLVGRCIAAALNGGREELPRRRTLPQVPIHTVGGSPGYVRLHEIPEPARSFFERRLASAGIPLRADDPDPAGCAWAHDRADFIEGLR